MTNEIKDLPTASADDYMVAITAAALIVIIPTPPITGRAPLPSRRRSLLYICEIIFPLFGVLKSYVLDPVIYECNGFVSLETHTPSSFFFFAAFSDRGFAYHEWLLLACDVRCLYGDRLFFNTRCSVCGCAIWSHTLVYIKALV